MVIKNTKRSAKLLRAKELQRDQTEAEQILWPYLRDRKFFGKKFKRQFVVEGFIVDFYCPEDKIAIELDGAVHGQQKEHDLERQNILEENRIKVLRFKNNEILNNLKASLVTIKKSLTLLHDSGEGPKE